MQAICVTGPKSISPIATKKSYMAFLPAVLVTAGIAFLSLWEQPRIPREIAMHDKIMHGLMYTFLAVSWMAPISKLSIAKHRSPITGYLAVWSAVTAYGGLMEILQRFCTLTRSGEMADLYADALGALLGVTVVFVITSLRKNHQCQISNHKS